MNKKYRALILGLVVGLITLAFATASTAASWTSFKSATFSGIDVSPSLSSDTLNYVLTLSSAPTITLGGKTYPVNWVQAFYVVGKDEGSSFTASQGSTPGNWSWDAKGSSGQIAGWTGNGSNRIMPGKSKTFQFSDLHFKQGAVVAGFHIGYQDGSQGVTSFYRPQTVPEPSALLALGTLLPLSLIVRRKTARH